MDTFFSILLLMLVAFCGGVGRTFFESLFTSKRSKEDSDTDSESEPIIPVRPPEPKVVVTAPIHRKADVEEGTRAIATQTAKKSKSSADNISAHQDDYSDTNAIKRDMRRAIIAHEILKRKF